jgi:integrase
VAALTGGTFVDPSKETVGEFLHRWLRDDVEPSLALRTQQRHREIVEHDLVRARQLLRALRGSPDELPLRVALRCGLRLSELLALRWGDVDLAM